jgi:hypothetical protein
LVLLLLLLLLLQVLDVSNNRISKVEHQAHLQQESCFKSIKRCITLT